MCEVEIWVRFGGGIGDWDFLDGEVEVEGTLPGRRSSLLMGWRNVEKKPMAKKKSWFFLSFPPIYALEVQRSLKEWVFTKDYCFSRDYNQQFQGTIILMVLDFQGMYECTPQKSNIDTRTKNCHFLRELPFPNHHFEYPAVSFRGWYGTQILKNPLFLNV